MLLVLEDLEKEVLFQKALSSNLVCHAFCSEAAPVFSVPGSVMCDGVFCSCFFPSKRTRPFSLTGWHRFFCDSCVPSSNLRTSFHTKCKRKLRCGGDVWRRSLWTETVL